MVTEEDLKKLELEMSGFEIGLRDCYKVILPKFIAEIRRLKKVEAILRENWRDSHDGLEDAMCELHRQSRPTYLTHGEINRQLEAELSRGNL